MSALIACNTSAKGLENIARSGAALIVANPPTGIADGNILNHLLAPICRNLYFYANSDDWPRRQFAENLALANLA